MKARKCIPASNIRPWAICFRRGSPGDAYAPSAGSIWTAPNAIQHICQSTGPGGKCDGQDWNAHVDLKPARPLGDSDRGKFRSSRQHRRRRALIGGVDHQRGWQQHDLRQQHRLLEEHRDIHHVGRLGRVVRPRAADDSLSAAGGPSVRVPRPPHRSLRVYAERLDQQRPPRLRQHFKVC